MARGRRKHYAYPISEQAINDFKAKVMQNKGYNVDEQNPDQVKFEVAHTLGVPLNERDNGNLSTRAAGKVGGPIGGAMVREMVRMAQQTLARQGQKP